MDFAGTELQDKFFDHLEEYKEVEEDMEKSEVPPDAIDIMKEPIMCTSHFSVLSYTGEPL